MSLIKIHYYDPFRSFAKEEEGRRRKRFLEGDGSATYDHYGKEMLVFPIWSEGLAAYDVIVKKMGYSPSIDVVEELVAQISSLEESFSPGLTELAEDIISLSGEKIGVDVKDHAWIFGDLLYFLFGFFVKTALPAKTLKESDIDFELYFSVLALVAVDDCIKYDQSGYSTSIPMARLHRYMAAVARIRSTIDVSLKVSRGAAVHAADARHMIDREAKRSVIEWWEANRHTMKLYLERPNMRQGAKDFLKAHSDIEASKAGVTPFPCDQDTVWRWIRDYEKQKNL